MTHQRAVLSWRPRRRPRSGQRDARAPRARLWHLVAICIVSVVLAARIQVAAAEPCAVRTELTGDHEAVQRVAAELQQLGVQLGAATPGCRALRAAVELDREGGIAVAIQDGSTQRSEGRVVSDAAVAAAWIDSFLRDDVDGFQRAPQHTAPAAAVAATTTATVTAEQRPEHPAGNVPLLDRFGTSVAFEQTWPEGDATASGIGGAACVRVAGRFCLGLRGRYAREADRAVNSTAMARNDIAALATASTWWTVGNITIAPELGLGVGRRSTRRLDCTPAPPPNCDPTTDPACDPNGNIPPSPNDPGQTVCKTETLSKLYVGDNLSAITYTPRAAAALRIAIPLFDHVWLEGLASFELAPFGHTGNFATVNATGTVATETALPGEPSDTLQLGVGLRVGAP